MCPSTISQLSRQKRSHCIKRSTRVAHFGSKFLSGGVVSQKIDGRFNVLLDRRQTKAKEGVWLNGDGGFILDVKSARKVEKLLGDTWFH